MKKIAFKKIVFSSFLLFMVCNAFCQTAPARLKYFGFYLVNTFVDDKYDGVAKTNYTDEVSSFTNLNQSLVFNPLQDISGDVNAMNAECTKPFMACEQIFWRRVDGNAPSGNNYDIYPDWQARWNTFKATNAVSLTPEKIGCFYIADEPLWNGIPNEELAAVSDVIKNDYPAIPIFYIEAYPQVANMVVPASVDWIGFDQYFIFDPLNNSQYLGYLNALKSKRSNNQKIFIIGDSHWVPIYGSEGNVTPADMLSTVQSYYDLAVSDPDVIGLIEYEWPGGFDGAGSLGARNLPQAVIDKLKNQGQMIKANYSPCTSAVGDTEAPSVPAGLTSSKTETSFTLSWNASTDNVGVHGYRIYKNNVYIAATTNTFYEIKNLSCATSYSIKVSAFDNNYNASDLSAEYIASTDTCNPAHIPPSVPTGLTASAITKTSFTLSWTPSTDNVSVFGYEIFKNGEYFGATRDTFFNVTGLTCGSTYNFTLDAFDAEQPANISGYSAPKTVTTDTCVTGADTIPPSVPVGLTASAITVTSFKLRWNASTDNVAVFGYDIYVNGNYYGGTRDTSFTITGLACGTAYNITVDAFDHDTPPHNISAASDIKTVTTATCGSGGADTQPPSIPTGLTASAITQTSFTLSWKASTDNVRTFGYEIFKDGVYFGATTDTSFNVTGLTCASSYNFTIDAFDAAQPANISAYSAPKSVTTATCGDNQAPSIPTGLTASAITQTSFTLSWNASTDNVGTFGYEIFKDGVYFGATTDTSFNVTGLTCANTYNFTVDAFDAAQPANISAFSVPKSVTTAVCADIQAPSIPTGLAASAITQTSFTLSWNASIDNVGTFGYEIYKNGVYFGATTDTSFNVTGLACGTAYNFTVNSFDAAQPANISAFSAPTSVTTATCADTQAPSVPTGLTASAIAQTSFTLSWNASTDNVGTFGYEIYKNGAYYGATTDTSLVITGLTCGTAYNITVNAFDAAQPANISAFSAPKSVTTYTCVDTQAPSIPSGLTGSAIAQTSFTLSWNASTDNVGVKGYKVFKNGVYIGTTSSASFNVTGLSCGTTYSFKVSAFDGAQPANVSGLSIAKNITTYTCADTQAPSIPSGLTTSSVTRTSLVLSWSHSTDNVGVLGYKVFKNGVYIGTTNSVSFNVRGLTCGTLYNFKVSAFDGAANVSALSNVKIGATVTCLDTQAPSIPTGLAASAITRTSVILSWSPSTDNVGVAGYKVFRNGVYIGTTSSASITVTGLSCGKSYNFRVKAFDGSQPANVSGLSTAINLTTLSCADVYAPSVPKNLNSFSVTKTSFKLLWSASKDNVGVVGYRVYKNGVYAGTSNSTCFTVTGLNCGTTYRMTVRAFDAANNVSCLSKIEKVVTTACSNANSNNIIPGTPNTIMETVAGNAVTNSKTSKDNKVISPAIKIKLYPNPAQEYVIVDGLKPGAKVTLVSNNGQVVSTAFAKSPLMRMELVNLKAGFYIIKVETDGKSSVSKFLKF
jgi:chitodextrinase